MPKRPLQFLHSCSSIQAKLERLGALRTAGASATRYNALADALRDEQGQTPSLDLLLEVLAFQQQTKPPEDMAEEKVADWRAAQLGMAADAIKAPSGPIDESAVAQFFGMSHNAEDASKVRCDPTLSVITVCRESAIGIHFNPANPEDGLDTIAPELAPELMAVIRANVLLPLLARCASLSVRRLRLVAHSLLAMARRRRRNSLRRWRSSALPSEAHFLPRPALFPSASPTNSSL